MNTYIGFATQFYTLWNVTKEDIYSTVISANGENHFKSGERFICTYIKNVSTDLNKVKELYPNAPIDENLRGQSRDFEYSTGTKGTIYASDVFTRGYNKGLPIFLCNSIKDLKWALENEYDSERVRNIKTQLISLGMVEFEGKMYDTQMEVDDIINQRSESELLRKKSEAIYSALANGGEITINFTKNLSSSGRYYDAENGVSFLFNDIRNYSYNGYDYSLPVLNGTGKKIKGKAVKINAKSQEDEFSEYGGLILVVESFKII